MTKRLLVIIPPDNPLGKVNMLLRNLDAQVDHARWSICPMLLEENYRSIGLEPLRSAVEDADAVIWWYADPKDEARVRALARGGRPVVTYNRDFPNSGAMGVVADVAAVAHAQFRRLWDIGKRRLAVVAVDRPSPSITQYVRIMEQLARAAGEECDFRTLLLPYSPAHRPTPRVMAMVAAMMDGWPHPDGVLCAEIFSFHAVESWLALRPHVRVPEDVAVAAFDHINRPNVVRLMGNMPNACHDEPAMVRAAMGMIESRLAGEAVPRISRVPAVMAGMEAHAKNVA